MKRSVLFALVTSTSLSIAAPSAPPERAKIDALAKAEIEQQHAVGLTVVVARGDKTIVSAGYGFADLAAKTPATADTLYRIGSVTKQFTAVAILQLVEQKKLALTDDIRTYVPEFPKHDSVITIEQLLTHTSGVPTFTDTDWLQAGQHPLTHAQVLARFATKPLEFIPGSKWAYSNSNYYLLGMAIEKLTKQTYGDAIRERVLLPAGMTRSGACDAPQLAHGYASAVGPIDAMPFDNGPPFAAGALCATAPDLLAWQRALEHGKVITPASLAKMRTNAKLSTGALAGYGYGVFVADLEGHHRIEHEGGINGFISELARYPDDDVTIVVLANTEGPTPTQLEKRIARVMLSLPEPSKGKPLASAERTPFVGSYDLQGVAKGLRARVFDEKGTLRVQLPKQPSIGMNYQGDGKFTLDMEEPVEIDFAADRAKLTLHQHGLTIEALRVAP